MMLFGLTLRGWLVYLCCIPVALGIVYLVPGHSFWVAFVVGAVCSLVGSRIAKAVQS